MIRPPLDADISPLQELFLSRVEDQFNIAFDHDTVIQALRPVHHGLEPWREIYKSQHRTTRVDDSKLFGAHQFVMPGDVGIVVQ